MALEAFLTLKEKKKNNILNAISVCLHKTNYDELSVNDIVKEADISRGSFYNYFKDKNDAVETLVDSKLKDHFDQYLNAISKSNCSLFEGTKKVYLEVKDILKDEINITVMRNIKFFMDLVTKVFYSKEQEKYMEDIITWLIDNTIEGKETLNAREKMGNVFDMIIMLIVNSVFLYTIKDDDKESDAFDFKLDLIRKGIRE